MVFLGSVSMFGVDWWCFWVQLVCLVLTGGVSGFSWCVVLTGGVSGFSWCV